MDVDFHGNSSGGGFQRLIERDQVHLTPTGTSDLIQARSRNVVGGIKADISMHDLVEAILALYERVQEWMGSMH